MLNAQQIANKVSEYLRNILSLSNFDDWFSNNSWSVHRSENKNLIDLVFRIEESFSAYYDRRLDENLFRRQLAEIFRSVVRRSNSPSNVMLPSVSIDMTTRNGIPVRLLASESPNRRLGKR
jgi:hypothetical protein